MQQETDPRFMPCPDQAVWDTVAAGLTAAPEAAPLLEHASFCPRCAEMLRASLRIFADGEAPETKPSPASIVRFSRGWMAIAAGLLVAAAVAGWLRWRGGDPSVLLAELAKPAGPARASLMRMPGAVHKPYDPTRSGGPRESPAAWLEVRARAQRELGGRPDDAAWLHVRGRVALLEQDAEAAVTALRRAADLAATPDSALQVDLAAAYYLRARRDNNPADLSRAVEELSQVLRREPEHREARFNRAVAEEDLGLLAPAIEDYEKLIAIENDTEWRKEAAERLERLKSRRGALDQRGPPTLEERLEETLRRGLDAAGDIAGEIEQRHGDQWLRAALPLAHSPAVAVLARMAQARATGSSGAYAGLDRDFDSLPALPAPLEAWRRFEALFRATHSPGHPCPPERPLPASGWFAAQQLREYGVCRFRRQDLTGALEAIRESEGIAARNGWKASEIRGRGLRASLESRRGRQREAMRIAVESLREIADSKLPPVRMQQFASALMYSSLRLGHLHSARRASSFTAALARDAGLDEIAFNGLGMWAELAYRTGENEEAVRVQTEALRLGRSSKVILPDAVAWVEAYLAARNGDGTMLSRNEATFASSKDSRLRAQFHQLLAGFEIREGRRGDALRRLENLLGGELRPASADPIWRDQAQLALERVAGLLLDEGRHADALARLHPSARTPSEGQVVFAMAVLGERVGVWRQRPSGVDFRWASCSPERYQRDARRLRTLLETAESGESGVWDAARVLETSLLAGWSGELAPGTSIHFVPDPRLIEIPFALLTGERTRDSAVTTGFPGAAPVRAGSVLVVDATRAALAPEWKLAPLEPAEGEVRALRLLGRPATVLAAGEASATRMLREMRSRKYGLLHFAGHAIPQADGAALVAGADRDRPDGLFVPSRDGAVPEFAVLSACSTGRARRDEVDSIEPETLARAFLARGTRQVVASYWEVESGTATKFMTGFYGALARHPDAGRAWLEGVRAVRAEPRYRHPHHWAAFGRWIRQITNKGA